MVDVNIAAVCQTVYGDVITRLASKRFIYAGSCSMEASTGRSGVFAPANLESQGSQGPFLVGDLSTFDHPPPLLVPAWGIAK